MAWMGSYTDSDDPGRGVHGPRMGQTESWPAAFAELLKQARVPLPLANAWLVTMPEFFGGLALLIGAFVALVRYSLDPFDVGRNVYRKHQIRFSAVNRLGIAPKRPQLSPPGYEVNLLYIAGLVALILGSAGPLSIDALRSRRRQRE